MDEDFDPLNISKVESTETKEIPAPTVRIIPKTSGTGNLFEVVEEKKKKKSIKGLKVDKNSLFDKQDNADNFFANDFTIFKPKVRSTKSASDILTLDKEDFTIYIDRDSISSKFMNPTAYLKSARNKILESDIAIMSKTIKDLKVELNIHVIKKTEILKNRTVLIQEMHDLFRQGVEQNRERAAIQSIYQRKNLRLHSELADLMKTNISRCSMYMDFLKSLPKNYPLIPSVDTERFLSSLVKTSARTQKLEKQLLYLEKQIKPLVPTKPGSGDWYENTIHPQSNSGKIIQRFEDKISVLKYPDVFTICEHLAENTNLFSDYEHLLFDIAWSHTEYPFGINKHVNLPRVRDFFPSALAKTDLPEQYAKCTFNALNGTDWPFKTVVDMIFNMLILTNPFDIARVFWDVIQETAKCMSKILVVYKGVNPDDVEIDFDSLFPILQICILAFGCDEWMSVALYTMSFNESVSDDPQLQFAMTYLEGLVTQMMALDIQKLKQKTAEIRDEVLEEDPLGVL